jgi:hypothetical protein
VTTKSPTWAYRPGAGGVESRLFEDGNIPDGWHDSPAKCVAPVPEAPKPEAPKPAGKKRAAKDNDG